MYSRDTPFTSLPHTGNSSSLFLGYLLLSHYLFPFFIYISNFPQVAFFSPFQSHHFLLLSFRKRNSFNIAQINIERESMCHSGNEIMSKQQRINKKVHPTKHFTTQSFFLVCCVITKYGKFTQVRYEQEHQCTPGRYSHNPQIPDTLLPSASTAQD